MPYRRFRLCSNGGGYEAIPVPRLRLDLGQIRRALESDGIPVVDARVMLIANLPPEITLSQDGRFLVKSRTPREAEAAFERVQKLVFLPPIEVAPVSPASANR